MGQSDGQGRWTACLWRLQVKGTSKPSAASFPVSSMGSEGRLWVGEKAAFSVVGPTQVFQFGESKKAVLCDEKEKYTGAEEKTKKYVGLYKG